MAFAYAGVKVDLDDASFNRSVNSMTSLWKSSMDSMATEAKAFDTRWHEATAGIKDTKRIVSGILVSQAFYTLSNVMIDASVAAVQFSKDMETAAISMEYFVKGADKAQKAAAYLREINLFAARTPFSTQEALSLSKYMQAMGVGMENTKSFLKVITDTAAATGATEQNLQRITFGLGQMLTKGRLANEEIRQLANANIPIYDILQEQLGLTGDQISKIGNYWVNADKAVVAILNGLEKRYAGAADRVAETVTGMSDTIRDNLLIITQQAGSGAYEAFADKMRVVRDALDRYRDTSTTLGSAGLFTQILEDLNAVGPVGDYILALIGNVRNLAGALSQAAVAASPLFKILGTSAYTEISVLGYSLTMLCNALTLTVDAVGNFANSMGVAGSAVKIFGTGLASLFIMYKAAQAVSFLGQGISRLGQNFVELTMVMGKTIPFFANQSVMFRTVAGGALAAASGVLTFIGVYQAMNNLMAGFDPKSSGGLPDDYMSAYEKYAAAMETYNQQIQQYQESFNQPFGDISGSGEDGVSAFEDVAAASKKASKSVKNDWVAAFDEVYSIPDQSGSSSGTVPTPPDFGSLLSPLLFSFPTRDKDASDQPEFPWQDVFGGSPLEQTIGKGIDNSILPYLLLNLIGAGVLPLLGRIFSKNGSVKPEGGGGTGGTGGTGKKAPKTLEEEIAAARQKVEDIARDVRAMKDKLANASGEMIDPITKELKTLHGKLERAINEYAATYGSIDDIKNTVKDLVKFSEPDLRQKQFVSKFNEVIGVLKTQQLTTDTLLANIIELNKLNKQINADITDGNTLQSELLPEVKEAQSRLKLLAELNSSLLKVAANTHEIKLKNDALAEAALQRATNPGFNADSIQKGINELIDANKNLTGRIKDLSTILRIPLNADDLANEKEASRVLATNKAFIVNFQNHLDSRLDDIVRPLRILENYNKSFLYKYSQPIKYLQEQTAKLLEITQYTKEMPQVTQAIKDIHRAITDATSSQQTLTTASVKKLQDNLIRAFKSYGNKNDISKATINSAIDVLNKHFDEAKKTNDTLEQIRIDLGITKKRIATASTTGQFNEMSTYRAFLAQLEKLMIDRRVPATKLEERLDALYDKFKAELTVGGATETTMNLLRDALGKNKDIAFEREVGKAISKMEDTLYGLLDSTGRHIETVENAWFEQMDKLAAQFGDYILETKEVKESVDKFRAALEERDVINRVVYDGMPPEDAPTAIQAQFDYKILQRMHTEFMRQSANENKLVLKEQGRILGGLISSNEELIKTIPDVILKSDLFVSNKRNRKLASSAISASELAAFMNGISGYGMTFSDVYANNFNADVLRIAKTPKTISQLIDMSYGKQLESAISLAVREIFRTTGVGMRVQPGRLIFTPDGTLQAQIDRIVSDLDNNPITGMDIKVSGKLDQIMKVLETESYGPEIGGIYEVTEKGFRDLATLFDDAFYQYIGQSVVLGTDTIYAAMLDVKSLNIAKPDATNYAFTKYDPANAEEVAAQQQAIDNAVLKSIDGVTDLLGKIKENVRVIRMIIPKDMQQRVREAAKAYQTSMTYMPELARLSKVEEFLQVMTKNGIVIGSSNMLPRTITIPEPTKASGSDLNTILGSIRAGLAQGIREADMSLQVNALQRFEQVLGTLEAALAKEVRNFTKGAETYGQLIESRVLELKNWRPSTASSPFMTAAVTTQQIEAAIDYIKQVKEAVDTRGLGLIREVSDIKKRADFYASQTASMEDKAVKEFAEYASTVFAKALDHFNVDSNAAAIINTWKENNAITEPITSEFGPATYTEYMAKLGEIMATLRRTEEETKKLGMFVVHIDDNVRKETEWTTARNNPNYGDGTKTGRYYAGMASEPEVFMKYFSKAKYVYFTDPAAMEEMKAASELAAKMQEALKSMETAGQRYEYTTKTSPFGKIRTEAVETEAYRAAKAATDAAAAAAAAAAKAATASSGTAYSMFGKQFKIPEKVSSNAGGIAAVALMIPSIISDIKKDKNFKELVASLPASERAAAEERGTNIFGTASVGTEQFLKEYKDMTEQEKMFWGSMIVSSAKPNMTMTGTDYTWNVLTNALNNISDEFSALPNQAELDSLLNKNSKSNRDTLTEALKDSNSPLAVLSDYIVRSGDTDSDIAKEFYKKYGKYMDTVVYPSIGLTDDWLTAVKDLISSNENPEIARLLEKAGLADKNISSVGELTTEQRSIMTQLLTSMRDSLESYYYNNEIAPKGKYNSANENPMTGDMSVYLGKGLDLSSISTDLAKQLRDVLGVTFRDIKDSDGHSTRLSQMNIDSEAIRDNIIGWTQALPKNIEIGEISTDDATILAKLGVQVNSDGTITFMKAMNENSTGSSRTLNIKADDMSKAVADALKLKGLELDFSGAETKLSLDVPKLAGEMHSALFMLNDSLTGEISDSMTSTLSGLGKILDSGYLEITNKAVLNGSMTITEYINSLGNKANELSPEVVKALEAIDNVIAQDGQRTAQSVAKWADGIVIASPIKEEQLTDEIRQQFAAIGVTFQEEEGKFYALVNRPGEMLKNGISIISQEDWNSLDAGIREGLEKMGMTFTEKAGIMMVDFNSVMQNGLSNIVELYVNNPDLWNQLPAGVSDALEACGFAVDEGMIKIDTTMLNKWTEIDGHFYQSWQSIPQYIKDSLHTGSLETENGLMEIQRYVEGMDTTGALVKDFSDLPPTLQAYLKQTAGVVEGEKVVIKNATEAAFLGFAQTVAATMTQAKDDTESNIKAMTRAITDGMLAVNRIMQVTSKTSYNPFDNNARPQWKQTATGWQVTYGGRVYVSPGSQTKAQAREYIQRATGVDIPYAAYGAVISGDQLIRAGEFGKKEAILPLEQPSVMAKLGDSIAKTMPIGSNLDTLIAAMVEQFGSLTTLLEDCFSSTTEAFASQVDTSSSSLLTGIKASLLDVTNAISEASSTLSHDISSAISQAASYSRSYDDDSSSKDTRPWQDSWHNADGKYMYDDVYAASGGLVRKQSWYMLGERDRDEVVIPLQNQGVLSMVGSAIAGAMDISAMRNGGVTVKQPQRAQTVQLDTSGITQTVLESILPMIAVTQGNNDGRSPLYVGNLVADERSLKLLERKLYDVRIVESTRRS